jgi:F-type H+-transporting ATPase subunit gamma
MSGSKEIKTRIRSVRNTKKITKAMELVAASKMKRAVSSATASRLYARYFWEVLTSVGVSLEETTEPLLLKRPIKNILLLLITSDRGLCGAYNSQVIKKALTLLGETDATVKITLVTIGKNGERAMRRIGKDILATFTELPSFSTVRDINPLSTLVIKEYTSEHFDQVVVAYTDFVSAMLQKPVLKQILPISKTDLAILIDESLDNVQKTSKQRSENKKVGYLIEGDKTKLLSSLAEKLCRMRLYQMVLESNASEHSARMMAMKNASEAAGEMIDDLTLAFNNARQSGITREISEISAGMASVE